MLPYLAGVSMLLNWPRVKQTLPLILLLNIIIRLVPILERFVRHPAVERTMTLVFKLSGRRRHGAMNAPLMTDSVLHWRVTVETWPMPSTRSSGPASALKHMVSVVWLFSLCLSTVVLSVLQLVALMSLNLSLCLVKHLPNSEHALLQTPPLIMTWLLGPKTDSIVRTVVSLDVNVKL